MVPIRPPCARQVHLWQEPPPLPMPSLTPPPVTQAVDQRPTRESCAGCADQVAAAGTGGGISPYGQVWYLVAARGSEEDGGGLGAGRGPGCATAAELGQEGKRRTVDAEASAGAAADDEHALLEYFNLLPVVGGATRGAGTPAGSEAAEPTAAPSGAVAAAAAAAAHQQLAKQPQMCGSYEKGHNKPARPEEPADRSEPDGGAATRPVSLASLSVGWSAACARYAAIARFLPGGWSLVAL
jgi:hypothetical protein